MTQINVAQNDSSDFRALFESLDLRTLAEFDSLESWLLRHCQEVQRLHMTGEDAK